MQQSDIFGILLTILNHRKVKREYLAEKFEVSTRTVQRYIDVLGEAGVPIISTRGKNGGFSVTDDFKLDSSFFTEAEVARIISCLNAMRPNYPDSICRYGQASQRLPQQAGRKISRSLRLARNRRGLVEQSASVPRKNAGNQQGYRNEHLGNSSVRRRERVQESAKV